MNAKPRRVLEAAVRSLNAGKRQLLSHEDKENCTGQLASCSILLLWCCVEACFQYRIKQGNCDYLTILYTEKQSQNCKLKTCTYDKKKSLLFVLTSVQFKIICIALFTIQLQEIQFL